MSSRKSSARRRAMTSRPSKGLISSVARELGDSNSYAGQKKFTVMLPGGPLLQTNTVTTGVLAATITVQTADVVGFATRFASTFDEYRILAAKATIRPVGQSVGLTKFMWDEKSATAPTSNDSQERVGKIISNNSSNSKAVTSMHWSARDLLDLQYTAIGTGATPAFFKIYTDAANWGSPIVATNLFVVNVDITVEFRGLKST